MLGLRVGFILSNLTVDKLSQLTEVRCLVHRRWPSSLRPKACLHLIIKPRVIHVPHTDELGWHMTSNQQPAQTSSKPPTQPVQNLNRIVSNPNVTPWQILYCTTDSISIDLMFQENFPTNTKVRNRLCHRNDCQERGVIWVTYRQCRGRMHKSSCGHLSQMRRNSRRRVIEKTFIFTNLLSNGTNLLSKFKKWYV